MFLKNIGVVAVFVFAMQSNQVLAIDAETLDVGGAKLGMSPEQVIEALKGNGWEVHVQKANSPPGWSPDFEDEVRKALKQPLKGTNATLRAKFIKGGEVINASFVALPSSVELYSLQYSIDDPALTFDDFALRTLQRYGKPDTRDIVRLSGSMKTKPMGWGKFGKDGNRSSFLGSYLVVHTSGGGSPVIWLEDNGQRATRQRAEIAKAVAAAPKPKTSF